MWLSVCPRLLYRPNNAEAKDLLPEKNVSHRQKSAWNLEGSNAGEYGDMAASSAVSMGFPKENLT